MHGHWRAALVTPEKFNERETRNWIFVKTATDMRCEIWDTFNMKGYDYLPFRRDFGFIELI
jgi:hypothetical protein